MNEDNLRGLKSGWEMGIDSWNSPLHSPRFSVEDPSSLFGLPNLNFDTEFADTLSPKQWRQIETCNSGIGFDPLRCFEDSNQPSSFLKINSIAEVSLSPKPSSLPLSDSAGSYRSSKKRHFKGELEFERRKKRRGLFQELRDLLVSEYPEILDIPKPSKSRVEIQRVHLIKKLVEHIEALRARKSTLLKSIESTE